MKNDSDQSQEIKTIPIVMELQKFKFERTEGKAITSGYKEK